MSQDGWQTSKACEVAESTKIATCSDFDSGTAGTQAQAGTVEVRYTNTPSPSSHLNFTDYATVEILGNSEFQLRFSEAGNAEFPSLAGGLVGELSRLYLSR